MANVILVCVLMIIFIAVTAYDECDANNIPKFTAILVFGDSSVDTGNNNYIKTAFKGNHPPYGVDYPGGIPTGRFSNGKLVPDILASMVGLKETIPPFLQPSLSDRDVLTGVSFASAGSGYDELTTIVSRVIPLSTQVRHFKQGYVPRLRRIVGDDEKEVHRILSGALVVVSAATNDFIFNFYDVPSRRAQFTIDGYQDFLLQHKLQDLIQELYYQGCRKMVVPGLPPLGCLPIQRTVKSRSIIRSCSFKENLDAQSYNDKLQKLLTQLQTQLPGSKILYVDTYNPLMDMITKPQKFGFVETTRGCCGSGVVEAGPLCTPLSPICSNTSQYLFWDSIHPSESTYRLMSEQLAQLLLPNLSYSKSDIN